MEVKQQMMESLDDVKTQLVNGLGYQMPAEVSVSVRRTHKRQFPQKSAYTSQEEIIIDFNTGADFLNAHRSWLNFSVQATAASTWGEYGGAPNVIERVVVSTRSGVELSRLENANLYYAKHMRWACSRSFHDQWHATMGYAIRGGDEQKVGVASPTQYSMPLAMLSPFFRGDGKTLIPPQLAAGLRVSITLAADSLALVSANAGTTYTVSGISIQTNLSTIVDDWQRRLNQMSAEQGLVYPYTECHTTLSSLAESQTSVNIQVRKAVARALKACTVTRNTAVLSALGQDSMASENFAVDQFQWRLGSVYFPQQPVSSDVEAFYIAQNAFDGGLVDCRDANGVSFPSFQTGGNGVTAVSMERSDIALNDVLNISGLPTNNSRALDADITFSAPAARTTVLYMEHVKIARCFLDNTVVSE
jgi:hypothetical protein